MSELGSNNDGLSASAFYPAEELNRQIADQNARAEQLDSIDDPQFLQLAVGGLQE